MDVIKQVREFFSYWYLRYLVATELYMVEPWEKRFIHAVFIIVLSLFFYFNTSIIVSSIAHLRGCPRNIEVISKNLST